LGIVGAGILVIVVAVCLLNTSRSMGRIRVTATPPGDAPEEIRRAWIGLELPLSKVGVQDLDGEGVLSRRGAGSVRGYVVLGKTAVALLASQAPEAAEWWRRNAPHVVASGYELIFPESTCVRIFDSHVLVEFTLSGSPALFDPSYGIMYQGPPSSWLYQIDGYIDYYAQHLKEEQRYVLRKNPLAGLRYSSDLSPAALLAFYYVMSTTTPGIVKA
jgi:hypothetical protein